MWMGAHSAAETAQRQVAVITAAVARPTLLCSFGVLTAVARETEHSGREQPPAGSEMPVSFL